MQPRQLFNFSTITSGITSKDATRQYKGRVPGKVIYRIGGKAFLEKLRNDEVLNAHRKQLEALERVLEKAPSGRDVGSSIERVVRFCQQ